MKKLALILTLAFTMSLGASIVSATTQDKTTKAKTECCAKTDKKAACTKEEKAACTKDAKACTEKKAEVKEVK